MRRLIQSTLILILLFSTAFAQYENRGPVDFLGRTEAQAKAANVSIEDVFAKIKLDPFDMKRPIPPDGDPDFYSCGDRWPHAQLPYHWTPNHCGPDAWYTPAIPDKIYGGLVSFKDACDNHDRCFMSTGKWRESQEDFEKGRFRCDVEFLLEMRSQCQKGLRWPMGNLIAMPCLATAETYYNAVRLFGKNNYRKGIMTQLDFEQCVKDHGYHKWTPPPNPFRQLDVGHQMMSGAFNGMR